MSQGANNDLSPAISLHQIGAIADPRQPLRVLVANFNAFEAMFEQLREPPIIELGKPLPHEAFVPKLGARLPEPLRLLRLLRLRLCGAAEDPAAVYRKGQCGSDQDHRHDRRPVRRSRGADQQLHPEEIACEAAQRGQHEPKILRRASR